MYPYLLHNGISFKLPSTIKTIEERIWVNCMNLVLLLPEMYLGNNNHLSQPI
jgi:hypothetical protein